MHIHNSSAWSLVQMHRKVSRSLELEHTGVLKYYYVSMGVMYHLMDHISSPNIHSCL